MLAAAAASLFALAAFLTLHAIVIAPIWWSAAKGLPFVLVSSLAIAPAFHFLVRRTWHAALFGAGLWLCIVPPALLKDAVYNNDVVTTSAAALTGALLAVVIPSVARNPGGRAARRSIAMTMLSGALAGAAILVASAGPLSIFRSARAVRMFAGLLPLCVAYSIVIALTASAFSAGCPRRLSPSVRSFFGRPARRSHSSAR